MDGILLVDLSELEKEVVALAGVKEGFKAAESSDEHSP